MHADVCMLTYADVQGLLVDDLELAKGGAMVMHDKSRDDEVLTYADVH